MKSARKFGLFVFGAFSAFISTAAIGSSQIPKAQAANIVVNGDFTADSLLNPKDPTRNNPFITGWFNSESDETYYTTYLDNYTVDGAENNSLSVRIAAHREDSPEGSIPVFTYISQNLNTIVGQTYELSYNLANIDEDNSNEFQTYVGGKLIDDRVNVPWQQFNIDPTLSTFNFVATSNVTELKFAGKQRSAWFNIDNVSVRSVPEPSFLCGIAILGLMGIRLKKSV
ncbi:hypothetical protein I8752_30930 [Nostocaceae cyanobacterium CENA369]|uniref:DUF642 domain-containing protein n=1 Tax=Dendronalium phyllosphericum CENA369 TaxID=1725256 RepID=A0A8J7I862_9NOST|nr:hypothetical protein [Dendronalium phyllosphericum]MBH8577304.1 hypothetical protein [Dendronalium phyllosphericum CENA369]